MTGALYGLDYAGVDRVAFWYGFDLRDPDLANRLRILEEEYIRTTHSEAKAKAKALASSHPDLAEQDLKTIGATRQ